MEMEIYRMAKDLDQQTAMCSHKIRKKVNVVMIFKQIMKREFYVTFIRNAYTPDSSDQFTSSHYI